MTMRAFPLPADIVGQGGQRRPGSLERAGSWSDYRGRISGAFSIARDLITKTKAEPEYRELAYRLIERSTV